MEFDLNILKTIKELYLIGFLLTFLLFLFLSNKITYVDCVFVCFHPLFEHQCNKLLHRLAWYVYLEDRINNTPLVELFLLILAKVKIIETVPNTELWPDRANLCVKIEEKSAAVLRLFMRK